MYNAGLCLLEVGKSAVNYKGIERGREVSRWMGVEEGKSVYFVTEWVR